ncbi:hypothetical protein J3R83DRAFT_1377, partial [Lanmaoa asiatica]
FIVAAISFLAFVFNICRSHLPSNKIKVLESLLDETEMCFKRAIEDGLLTELTFVQWAECRLTVLQYKWFAIPGRAYNAISLCKDYIKLLSGTSLSIGTLQKVRSLSEMHHINSPKSRSH